MGVHVLFLFLPDEKRFVSLHHEIIMIKNVKSRNSKENIELEVLVLLN